MKKPERATKVAETMRNEYDFSSGVRGKYAERFRAGTNLVLLDPDVAATFTDAEAVNRALRALIAVVPPPPKRGARTRKS